MTERNDELLLCPFCGNEAKARCDGNLHYVECLGCGAVSGTIAHNYTNSLEAECRAEIIKAWNTRKEAAHE